MTSAAWAGQTSVEKTEVNKQMAEAVKVEAEATESKIRFGSYKNDPKAFSGEIAGGYSADDLLGMNLVDAKGDSIGEVHDLLVSADNKIERAPRRRGRIHWYR